MGVWGVRGIWQAKWHTCTVQSTKLQTNNVRSAMRTQPSTRTEGRSADHTLEQMRRSCSGQLSVIRPASPPFGVDGSVLHVGCKLYNHLNFCLRQLDASGRSHDGYAAARVCCEQDFPHACRPCSLLCSLHKNFSSRPGLHIFICCIVHWINRDGWSCKNYRNGLPVS